MEAPGFDEHRSGRNAWAMRASRRRACRPTTSHQLEARRRAPARPDDVPDLGGVLAAVPADEPRSAGGSTQLPKYVVSKTLDRADWDNTTILRGDPAEEVAALKAALERRASSSTAARTSSPALIERRARRRVPDPGLPGRSWAAASGCSATRRTLRSPAAGRARGRSPSGVVLLVYEPRGRGADGQVRRGVLAGRDEQVESLHAAQDTDRVLATVLFTDIVDSTGRAAALGDRAWRQLLDRHDEIARPRSSAGTASS